MFSRPSRQQRQTGVISVMAALALGVSVVVAALALDLGRIYWIKRDLQKAADLASLSAVSDLTNAQAIAQRIANANGFVYPATGNAMTVTTGAYNWTDRAYTPGGAVDPNSVEVIVSTTVPYYFIPGSLRVTASAVSVQDPIAGFSLGSFLARLDTTDSALLNGLLGGLLGSSINLDLVSYQGLAAGNVKLGDLQLALGLGTVNELLDTRLTLSSLLDASITALSRKGDAVSINAAGILGTLSAAASPDRSLRVGDLLKVDTSNPQAAANAEVNVMELVQLGAQVAIADGNHFVDISNLGISVPGILTIKLALSVIEAPTIAIGPARRGEDGNWITRAHAAQVRLKLNLILAELLGGGLINLPVYIEAGAADAALTRIQCRSPRDDSEVTIQVQPQALTAYVGEVSPSVMHNHTAPVTVTEAKLVNVLNLITLTGYAKVPLGGGSVRDLVFTGPFPPGINPDGGTAASLGVGSRLNSELVNPANPGKLTLKVLFLTLTLDDAIAILGPVLGAVDALLDPILSLLGIQLGGADVTVFYLNCGVPQLVH